MNWWDSRTNILELVEWLFIKEELEMEQVFHVLERPWRWEKEWQECCAAIAKSQPWESLQAC